jgi:hypothetical protein
VIGRQLIDALRQPEPEPHLPSVPKLPPLPVAPGVLGYAVARYDGPRAVLTHTSLMPLDEARREADAQRAADRTGYGWAVVEVRVMGP